MYQKITLAEVSLFISLFLSVAQAQKLPNKQEVSVRAPANMKVDGKATEWDNKLQAYNHATEVYYTLANDDKYLYLTVQATNGIIINRIMNGGISFAVNASGKKEDKGNPIITFPVFDHANRFSIGAGGKEAVDRLETNAALHQDSVARAYNKRLEANAKYIMVTGIKGIDTLISVYNDVDIKAAHRFDNNMAYTYELSVPLKYLGLATGTSIKFAYHITLNGMSILNKKFNTDGNSAPLASDNGLLEAKLALANQSSAPTDLWGEYTLAK